MSRFVHVNLRTIYDHHGVLDTSGGLFKNRMKNKIAIRKAQESDHPFIFELSPFLAEVAQLPWHSDDVVQQMQDDYISQMLAETPEPSTTFVAEINEVLMGFIHVRTHKDSISGEVSGTIPLLAVSPKSQGLGVGKCLIEHAEEWAKQLGCRLMHLEVFANNTKARSFYQKVGFKPETVHMIKPI